MIIHKPRLDIQCQCVTPPLELWDVIAVKFCSDIRGSQRINLMLSGIITKEKMFVHKLNCRQGHDEPLIGKITNHKCLL